MLKNIRQILAAFFIVLYPGAILTTMFVWPYGALADAAGDDEEDEETEETAESEEPSQTEQRRVACLEIENAEWGNVLKRCKCKNGYEWGDSQKTECVITEKAENMAAQRDACDAVGTRVAEWNNIAKRCKCKNSAETWDTDAMTCLAETEEERMFKGEIEELTAAFQTQIASFD